MLINIILCSNSNNEHDILWCRLYNKKFNFDLIDYASIDKTDFWVFVEEEDPYLNYEELENAIYEEGAYPAATSAGTSSNIEG